jgi:hypothetical protein
MPYEVHSLQSVNITLVYKSLPLDDVDRNRLRDILGSEQSVVMDAPEMIVFIAPRLNIVVQLGDRRIRITGQSGRRPSETPMCSIAVQLDQMASSDNLVAYGFNYDVVFEGSETQPVSDFFRSRFITNEQRVAELLNGEILTSIPRLVFTRGEKKYDLILEPLDESHIKAHLNAHFQATSLPGEADLSESFEAELDTFLSIVRDLLEEL